MNCRIPVLICIYKWHLCIDHYRVSSSKRLHAYVSLWEWNLPTVYAIFHYPCTLFAIVGTIKGCFSSCSWAGLRAAWPQSHINTALVTPSSGCIMHSNSKFHASECSLLVSKHPHPTPFLLKSHHIKSRIYLPVSLTWLVLLRGSYGNVWGCQCLFATSSNGRLAFGAHVPLPHLLSANSGPCCSSRIFLTFQIPYILPYREDSPLLLSTALR